MVLFIFIKINNNYRHLQVCFDFKKRDKLAVLTKKPYFYGHFIR